MLTHRFMILSGVTSRIGLHAVMPKKHTSFPPLSEALCFSACFLKDPPPKYCSDWSALARLSQHNQQ